MSSFCATSRLSEALRSLFSFSFSERFVVVIVGSILSEVYLVQSSNRGYKQAIVADLDSRLDQWYITLPEQLQYQAVNKRQIPPQILLLHVRYWGAVSLLHRALWAFWCRSIRKLKTDLLLVVFQTGRGNWARGIIVWYSCLWDHPPIALMWLAAAWARSKAL